MLPRMTYEGTCSTLWSSGITFLKELFIFEGDASVLCLQVFMWSVIILSMCLSAPHPRSVRLLDFDPKVTGAVMFFPQFSLFGLNYSYCYVFKLANLVFYHLNFLFSLAREVFILDIEFFIPKSSV